jgi:hypothetical protein
MSDAAARRARTSLGAAGVTVLVMALALGAMTSSARARSLTVRSDPNDSFSVVDLRKISTDLSATHVFLKFSSWQRFKRSTMDQVGFYLDSAGTYRFDAFVEFFPGHRRLTCIAQRYPGGRVIGRRAAHRPSRTEASCELPRGWFNIDRTVRFQVLTGDDRAPDRGSYHRL